MNDYVEINTDGLEAPEAGNDLYRNREAMAKLRRKDAPEVTILIQTYNRPDKLKRCVESVLAYTKGVSCELVLVDNGSTDDTLAYLCSIPFERKRIVHVTNNLRVAFPSATLSVNDFAEYIAQLNDDIIVTEHWLDNLLACLKSDPKIGVVVPHTNNTSNLQEVPLQYSSYKEMQEKAREFNRSDPGKWEDRLRLITLGNVYRKEVLLTMGWPLLDTGFFHDFGDDDMIFSIRRAGYRAVLAGDTWICHDHDYRRGEEKDPEEFQRSLDIGRQNFRDKYFGIDAWDDASNFWLPFAEHIPPLKRERDTRVLGVDVRCGTPILDVKNILRRSGVFDTELSAFTQDAKYWLDLKTICAGNVACDREEFLADSFPRDYFDYIVVDRPVNRYHEPQKLLRDLFSLCAPGGYVLCKLKNTGTFKEYVNLLGQRDVYDPEFAYDIPLEAMKRALEGFGKVKSIVALPFRMAPGQQKTLQDMLPTGFTEEQKGELTQRMLCESFLFVVQKN